MPQGAPGEWSTINLSALCPERCHWSSLLRGHGSAAVAHSTASGHAAGWGGRAVATEWRSGWGAYV